ncbi:MAG: polysaccharide deacetylase family protein [Candidatus Aureabacteria bacterium]|nr:polysaccharide deacetylase family protein [Candidatus Auribacterota bacterium]
MYMILILFAALSLVGFSLRFNWWRVPRRGVRVLMYHKVSRRNVRKEKLRVFPEDFRRQLKYLKEKGYKSISLKELEEYLGGKRKFCFKPVVLSFDDGYKDNYLNAVPILSEYGFSAVFFISTAYVGKDNLWDINEAASGEPMMDWDEIKDLCEQGFEIGSHTVSHADLTKVPREEIVKELKNSKAVLESELGVEITAVSYPFGHYNREVMEVTSETGYSLGIATRHGINAEADNPLAVKRILIRGYDMWLDFILNVTRGRSHL